MLAVDFKEYGAPEVLRVVDVPTPEPAPGKVRIAIAAIGVNPADLKWRQGLFKDLIPVALPHIPGYDVAGTIDAIGSGVTTLGDRVCAMLDPIAKGGYAERVVCAADRVALIPDGLEFAAAATIPTPGLTGFQLIEEHLDVRADQTVLVTGATGAVGRFAVAAALARGAHVVAAVRAAHREEARRLGVADAIVAGEQNWPGHFDHIADTVGGPDVSTLCRRLTEGGRIRTAATTPIDVAGLTAEPVFIAVQLDVTLLRDLAERVDNGAIEVPIALRMPLTEAADAHRLLEAGGLRGKIILEP